MPVPHVIAAASAWGASDVGNLGMHAWAAATAAVVSASCAVVGSLLVVRRMSLFGDAISHAVLPGIAVAVLAGGRPGGPAVFVGAIAAALLTVWLAQGLRGAGGLADDAGAGVAFTTLFAIGVVLVTVYASRIDIDASCVLYGILELVPFDTVMLGGIAWPRAFLTGAVVLGSLAFAVAWTWNLQIFTAFDTDAARAAGVPVVVVTTGLLAATAVATVAGFEAVGAILVVAMLVVPAAAAELLAVRLHHMVVVAVLLAVTGAVLGYLAAWIWNTSAAGMIAVVLGLEYVAAAVLAPDGGLVSRLVSRGRLGWRVACEDRLAAAWRNEEATGARPPAPPRRPLEAVAGWWLMAVGRMDPAGRLTPVGRRDAELVVRSHRLWEAWLGRHAELPLDHLHPPAEWVEHFLGAEVRRRIEADLGREVSDPHGRDIPPEA